MERFYYLVLDTETCSLTPSTEVDPYNMWVYDIGGAIVDRKGNVYKTFSYVISDIFQGEHDLMKSAYYADKLPKYTEDLNNGTRKMVTFYTARKTVCDLCKEYNVKAIIAHNARFDYGTLQNTQRWLTKSKYRNFFPYGIPIWDTMRMAESTICQQPTYRKWCELTNNITPYGNVRKSAEVLYRYISCDDDFIESHTALEDVLIEKEIFAKCMAQHKRMRKEAFNK